MIRRSEFLFSKKRIVLADSQIKERMSELQYICYPYGWSGLMFLTLCSNIATMLPNVDSPDGARRKLLVFHSDHTVRK